MNIAEEFIEWSEEEWKRRMQTLRDRYARIEWQTVNVGGVNVLQGTYPGESKPRLELISTDPRTNVWVSEDISRK